MLLLLRRTCLAASRTSPAATPPADAVVESYRTPKAINNDIVMSLLPRGFHVMLNVLQNVTERWLILLGLILIMKLLLVLTLGKEDLLLHISRALQTNVLRVFSI